MGYFLGINERQVFVDDDGLVYSDKHKISKLADTVEELLGNQKEAIPDTTVKAKYICEHCGYFTNYKMAYMQHMKKHKVTIE